MLKDIRGKGRKSIPVMLLLFALAGHALAEPDFDSKTKVRLVEKGIWLETEISPEALLAVLPQIDSNADGRLDEDELSNSRNAILFYYAQRVRLAANEKWLQADSTYFAFRSPAAPAAMPDRFYIYHWYAVLRQPEILQLVNRLFDEGRNACAHQGAIIANDKILKFDFPPAALNTGEKTTRTVRFELGKSGEVTIIETDNDVLQAGYLWLGLGLSGLLALRMASSVRRKLRRRQKEVVVEGQSEKLEMEESAVFS